MFIFVSGYIAVAFRNHYIICFSICLSKLYTNKIIVTERIDFIIIETKKNIWKF